MRQSKPSFTKKFTTELVSKLNFAIIVTKWNRGFNDEMCTSAKATLEAMKVPAKNIHFYEVPGAFEVPILAQKLAQLKQKRKAKYAAILCLGTIIRGDTYHFELVANESARGLMDVMIKTGVPLINGILAVDNPRQAEERASMTNGNKGRELALSALDIALELLK
jgi:6,7-dimethyl-8-ribityllumazine synthase